MNKRKIIASYIKKEALKLENSCIDLIRLVDALTFKIDKNNNEIEVYSHFGSDKDAEIIDNLVKDNLIYERELSLKKLELELEISKLASKNANLNWIDEDKDLED